MRYVQLKCVVTVVSALIAQSAVYAGTTGAQPTAKISAKAQPKPAKSEIEEAKRLLDSPDREKVIEGLKKLKELGKPPIAAPVLARLRRGLPPLLIDLAIQALVAIKSPQAVPVLIEFCGHRHPGVRKSAISALGALRARNALPALLDALDDGDPSVRAAAAEALGKVGSRQSLKQLYAAFERGDASALIAIAELANQEDVDKLVGYLNQHLFSALEPAFSAILKRDDLPSAVKQHLIARLGRTGATDAREYLRGLLNKPPKTGSLQWMRAIGRALQPNSEAKAKTESHAQPQPEAKSVPAKKEAK